jgi:hypothetical protein
MKNNIFKDILLDQLTQTMNSKPCRTIEETKFEVLQAIDRYFAESQKEDMAAEDIYKACGATTVLRDVLHYLDGRIERI